MSLLIFLDTNVILDALLSRMPNGEAALSLLEHVQHNRLAAYTSSSNLVNVIYFLKKAGLPNDKMVQLVSALVSHLKIISPNELTILSALASGFKDLEDAIQYYTALDIPGIDYFVTENTRDYTEALSQLPVVNTQAFLAKLPAK